MSHLDVSDTELLAIEDFLSRRSPRRFEPEATGDIFFLTVWLESKGHTIKRASNAVPGAPSRWIEIDGRRLSHEQFMAYVDQCRMENKLEPLSLKGNA